MYKILNKRAGRFVLLKHDVALDSNRENHWDLMLEWDDELVTFELFAMPSGVSDTLVTRLANHRLAYLDFEGTVSGNRGIVIRQAAGKYEFHGLMDRIEIELAGDRLTASVTFPSDSGHWCRVGSQIEMRIAEWNFRERKTDE